MRMKNFMGEEVSGYNKRAFYLFFFFVSKE